MWMSIDIFLFSGEQIICLSQYLDAANNFVPDSKGFCFIILIFKLLLCLYSSFWLALLWKMFFCLQETRIRPVDQPLFPCLNNLDGHYTLWKYMGCSVGYSSSVYTKILYPKQDVNMPIWVSTFISWFCPSINVEVLNWLVWMKLYTPRFPNSW